MKNKRTLLGLIVAMQLLLAVESKGSERVLEVQDHYSVAKQTPEDAQQVTVNIHLQNNGQSSRRGTLDLQITDPEGHLYAEKKLPVVLDPQIQSTFPWELMLVQLGAYTVAYTYTDESGQTLENQFVWETDPVNFFYAFTTPHRLTVALPDNNNKTLLDVSPGQLSLAWTYDNLIHYPYDSFRSIKARWRVNVQPLVNGKPFETSTWSRALGYLPLLENRYETGPVWVLMEVVGSDEAAIVRVTLRNRTQSPQQVQLPFICPGNWKGYNPGWIDPTQPTDFLLAGWEAPADQVILLGIGADSFPVDSVTTTQMNMNWELQPGETRTGWVIRPYHSFTGDVNRLRGENWAVKFDEARRVWETLIARTPRVIIPDRGATNAFYAGIADLFIMREPLGRGYLVTVPGTDVYRSGPNDLEPAIVTVALDQVGLPREAEEGYRVNWDLQTPEGDWTGPGGWGHLMWAVSGYKAWAVLEHFQNTLDTTFLVKRYPQLLASSRWQYEQRKKTQVLDSGVRPLTYGLMPQGMGDGGLMNGTSFYGIFYTHNIWAVYADSLAYKAALILGKEADARELKLIYDAAKADLLLALQRGAMRDEQGKEWLSSIPGKETGSCWGLLASVYPTELLPPNHPLMNNTIARIEKNFSPGGLPLHTGFMVDGMWVAIALNDFAQAHLARDESDEANALLYAVLNHGTPLYSWCEERGQYPGATQISGDLQHLWTPVAVVRFVRDMLVMEQGQTLHLCRGIARGWLYSGEEVGIEHASTHFGPITYRVRYDKKRSKVIGEIHFSDQNPPQQTILHCPLPGMLKVLKSSAGVALPDGSGIRFTNCRGTVTFEAACGERTAQRVRTDK